MAADGGSMTAAVAEGNGGRQWLAWRRSRGESSGGWMAGHQHGIGEMVDHSSAMASGGPFEESVRWRLFPATALGHCLPPRPPRPPRKPRLVRHFSATAFVLRVATAATVMAARPRWSRSMGWGFNEPWVRVHVVPEHVTGWSDPGRPDRGLMTVAPRDDGPRMTSGKDLCPPVPGEHEDRFGEHGQRDDVFCNRSSVAGNPRLPLTKGRSEHGTEQSTAVVCGAVAVVT